MGPQGTRSRTSDKYWKQPLKWNQEAQKQLELWAKSHRGKMACYEPPPERPRVFCASLADVFEDWQGRIQDANGRDLWYTKDSYHIIEPDDGTAGWAYSHTPVTMDDLRRDLFALIDATPNLDWLLVTKRPENIRRMWPEDWLPKAGVTTLQPEPRKNVWLLTSISDQPSADKQIPELLKCRDLVPVLGLSCEPLLGEVDLTRLTVPRNYGSYLLNALTGKGVTHHGEPFTQEPGRIDWCIIGSESGSKRRPMNQVWAEQIAAQCEAAGVKWFMKQMEVNGKVSGDIDTFPSWLQVRQYPEVQHGEHR